MYWYPLRPYRSCLSQCWVARCQMWALIPWWSQSWGKFHESLFFHSVFNQRLLQGTRCVFFLAEDMDSVRSSCRKAWATSARIQVVERRLLHSADDTPRLSLFMSSERVNLSCFLKKCYDASDVMLQMFINCLRPYCSQNLRLYVCFVGFSKFAAQKLQETLHCIVLLLLDGWNVFKSGSEVLRWMSFSWREARPFSIAQKSLPWSRWGRSRWEPLSTVQETCSRGAALTFMLNFKKQFGEGWKKHILYRYIKGREICYIFEMCLNDSTCLAQAVSKSSLKRTDMSFLFFSKAEHKIWFRRHRSVFGLMNPGWFSQAFWRQVLSKGVSSGTPQVLHVTGLTPVISVNTRAAWDHARAMKEDYCAWSQPGGHKAPGQICGIWLKLAWQL